MGKPAGEPSDSRWSTPPMYTCVLRGVTSALPDSWERIGMQGDLIYGMGRVGVHHRNSQSLDEIQQRKLLFHLRVTYASPVELAHFCVAAFSHSVALPK
ncbi:hypothetical protein EVAR_3211_1 [Eumeta japonica]|uniref:Uncharacterized protein n=1 Tax=Eumeta variegata TaxID=151549 RepID=A0A4C1SXD6_EUMVA|nr:hypothetical protein EVAR_3211_1 [Eumeta japonica]